MTGINAFPSNTNPTMLAAKPIKDLLAENKVNIFFHGHDHLYNKQEKDCLIYQETPQPSHPNFATVSYAADYGYLSGQILPQSGHLRVNVDPSGVKVDYVRAYIPANETTTRHNKDVSATYFIPTANCYNGNNTGVPVIWNSNYENEMVYPNPFSTETKIEFILKTPERIDLNLFNISGQLIKKLVVGTLVPAGKYKVIWDGKNDVGIEQASGVYWYKIEGELGKTKTGKIILQK
jgi:hypothetical protein